MAESGSAIQAVKKELQWRLPDAKVRAIKGAKGANDFMDMLGVFQSNPPARGTKEMLLSYSTMPWLRAAVDKIGSSVASMTWRVFVKAEVNDEGKRVPKRARQLQHMRFQDRKAELLRLKQIEQLVEIEEHPVIEALYATGPTFTGHTTRELSQKWLDLVGEAFWIKERNDVGMPINFIPVPPHWVTNTPRADKDYFELQPPNGKLEEVKPEDMIWFYHPDPHNPYERGSGMGVTLGDELETDEYASKFMKTFFYNSARPDFLISSNELRKEDTTRLEKRWVDKLRGWRRSFLPFFLNREVKVHQLGTDYSHLSMLELRKHQRDAVIQVYGVPPEVLGIVEASNRATSEVAEYLYARWVLIPRLEFLRTNLQHRLIYEYDDRLILDYDSPVAQDKEHILKVATIAPWSLMIDEWREMEGKLPLPDGQGQVFMKPLNYEAVLPEDLGAPYSQQDGEGDDGSNGDGGSSAEEDPPDEPVDDEPVEESIRHVWPELVANVVARQRVAPRIGTRKDQCMAVLRDMVFEIADDARKRSDDLESLIDGGDEGDALQQILDDALFASAIGPALAKLTSVYLLAAETAKGNLVLYAEDGENLDKLEPLYELQRARTTVEESVKTAISNALDAVLEVALKDHDAEKTTFLLIDAIGILPEDAERFVALEGNGDEVVAMFEKFIDEMADHAIVHMCNCAQEALWSEAVREGVLDPNAVARIWITRLGCRSCNECSGMDGVAADVDMAWDLPSGDTVVTPTRAHSECHCTEQLVRKEVQREAAE